MVAQELSYLEEFIKIKMSGSELTEQYRESLYILTKQVFIFTYNIEAEAFMVAFLNFM